MSSVANSGPTRLLELGITKFYHFSYNKKNEILDRTLLFQGCEMCE